MSEMHEVMGGCKICGRQMLTNGSPLVRRTCEWVKAIQKRERNRRTDARFWMAFRLSGAPAGCRWSASACRRSCSRPSTRAFRSS